MTEQLQYAAEHHKIGQCKQIAALLSSAPGQFHRRKRRLLYELLGLGESARASQVAIPAATTP
ncbi:hypothetical protein [Streptomyces lydicus]|uniref:hypothetical protein n=1 Tax=Streptomyces lydicus TaxID=47763 RepID=UPI0036E46091